MVVGCQGGLYKSLLSMVEALFRFQERHCETTTMSISPTGTAATLSLSLDTKTAARPPVLPSLCRVIELGDLHLFWRSFRSLATPTNQQSCQQETRVHESASNDQTCHDSDVSDVCSAVQVPSQTPNTSKDFRNQQPSWLSLRVHL